MHGVSLLRMVVVRDVRLYLQRNIVDRFVDNIHTLGSYHYYYFVSADQISCRREVCLTLIIKKA